MQQRKELPQTQRQDLWNREQTFKRLRRQQYLGSGRDEDGLEKELEAPFAFPGLPLPRAALLGVGKILCKKIIRKDPCLIPLLPSGGQPGASPHSQDSDPGEDTRLGPGSDCRCGSTRPGRAVRRAHPEVGPWRELNPGSGTRSNCRVCLKLGCTRCLGKCLELGEARGGCYPCFV